MKLNITEVDIVYIDKNKELIQTSINSTEIILKNVLKSIFDNSVVLSKVNLHGIASKNQPISSNPEQSDLHLTTGTFILHKSDVRSVNM